MDNLQASHRYEIEAFLGTPVSFGTVAPAFGAKNYDLSQAEFKKLQARFKERIRETIPQRLKPHYCPPYRRPKGLLHPVTPSDIEQNGRRR